MAALPRFAKVSNDLDFPREEREILAYWKQARIFEKTLEKPSPRGSFVFYEGPPTANGLPHNGHVLTRVIKDVFPRYKTMRGWSVPRKAGWDTHGLPVEVEVEKELRIHGKAAIEGYGVEPFIKKCIESVFRYTKEWEELTERVAFWVDLKDAYVTYHRSYVESVWWALSKLHDKGLLYQGHKVVWWWAQGGTALSSGEVGQGYKQVDDPSVYVAFPLVDEEGLSLLVWTTTPWTLPSNMYAAVRPDFDYVVAESKDGKRYVVAKGLLDGLSKKLGGLTVQREMKGTDLVGKRYRAPFDLYAKDAPAGSPIWTVVAADFVTLDAGTGIVHIAPAFGEDDHDAHRRLLRDHPDLPLFCAVKPDGTFVDALERYAGRWVKDCDKDLQHELKDRGLLVHAEQYRHDYPFCWRADSDPLIQYARPAWYIRTTALKDKAIENNRAVRWLPEHIQEGRFGDFLANTGAGARGRARGGAPPQTVCICPAAAAPREAPPSVADIEKKNPRAFDHFHHAKKADPTLSEHLIVHKPWIDQVTFPCAKCAGTMRRVPEVIDCWFDSGCMPFAQWGWPHQNADKMKVAFPADFISEAIDQTRGWFYSLLMISTLVFDEPLPRPFKTCIVLGHVSDKEGKKESKSKGNYTPPDIILDEVKMDFAVVDAAAVKLAKNVAPPAKGTAYLAVEDFEGMDLADGQAVTLSRVDDPKDVVEVKLAPQKGMARRQLVMHEADRATLGVIPTSVKDPKPVDVPWLSKEERVTLRDPRSTAPGADAFRWFFYAASPPWSATRHSLSNVRSLQKEFAVKLRNVYSFFTIYAGIDGFDPTKPPVKSAAVPELDRWMRSELALTVRDVTARMDDYDVYGATQKLVAFVDALSNWWVRRSRARFWRGGWDDDKQSAYETLYACLVTLAKTTAPFTPYGAEAMYRNLVAGAGIPGAKESVHLEDWPEADVSAVDEKLSARVAAVRALVSIGLQVRTQAKLKVRQPLRSARVVTARLDLDASSRTQLEEELNVLSVEVVPLDQARQYVDLECKPSFRALGQRGLGKEAQVLKKTMAAMSPVDAASLATQLLGGAKVTLEGVELSRDDVEIGLHAKEGFAAAGDRAGVVVLDTRLDDELRELGFVRELQSRVQAMRKDLSLEYTDRIVLEGFGDAAVQAIVTKHAGAISAEVLASKVTVKGLDEAGDASAVDLEGRDVRLRVTKA